MSGKTDVQFFYVVVTTNENPGSNQSLASVRVLFDGGADRLPPCCTGANTFYIVAIRFRMRANTFYALQHDFVRVQTRFASLQHDFVRMQTRFAPCNTISYACKHVLRLATRFRTRANTFYIVATTHSVVKTGFYIAAANDLGVEMTVTSLQQTIRGSK